MMQFEDWFKSWVLESVCSAGGGRSSVEVWHTTALEIAESLSGAILMFTRLLLMFYFFETDGRILDRSRSVAVSSLLLVLVSLGPRLVGFHRNVLACGVS